MERPTRSSDLVSMRVPLFRTANGMSVIYSHRRTRFSQAIDFNSLPAIPERSRLHRRRRRANQGETTPGPGLHWYGGGNGRKRSRWQHPTHLLQPQHPHYRRRYGCHRATRLRRIPRWYYYDRRAGYSQYWRSRPVPSRRNFLKRYEYYQETRIGRLYGGYGHDRRRAFFL